MKQKLLKKNKKKLEKLNLEEKDDGHVSEKFIVNPLMLYPAMQNLTMTLQRKNKLYQNKKALDRPRQMFQR